MRGFLKTCICPAAGLLIMTSCLSSTKTDGGQEPVSFIPVIGMDVRSADSAAFPEDMDFGVWGTSGDGELFMDRERVSFDGTGWTTGTAYLWPEDRQLRFFGYAPYGHNMYLEDDGSLTIEGYDTDGDSGELYISDVTPMLDKDCGKVYIRFSLATSKVDFRVANGLNHVTSVKLEKIVLCGVYVSGSFDSSAEPRWKPSGEKTDIVFYDSSATGISDDVDREPGFFGKTLNIIPQQSRPKVKVVYSFQTADSNWLTGQENRTEELEAEWQPGRHYTYTLTLTEGIVKHSPGIGSSASDDTATETE